MKEYPIPLLEMTKAIKSKRYENLYVTCRIETLGPKHFIVVKSNVTNTKTFWFYNESTDEYYEIGA